VICSVALSAGLGGWLLKAVSGIPYVVYAQGEEISGPLKSGRLGRLRYRLTRQVLSNADAVVCISRFTRNLARRHYGVEERRLHLFLPAIDVSEQQTDSERVASVKRAVAPDGPLLLMVGRLAQRRKGFDKTIQALPRILARYPAARLVIAGPGRQDDLRNQARALQVAHAVVFAGEVERRSLLALYAACDVFLLPVRTMDDGDTEGFGVVFLEANLMGKPVIAGRAGGVEDAVVDRVTGLLVDGDRFDEISAAVLELLGDAAQASRLGVQGKQRVLREFTAAAQQQAFRILIAQLLSTHGGDHASPDPSGGVHAGA
jgi:phosphatidyl-myo-inositol dimannoside synthase